MTVDDNREGSFQKTQNQYDVIYVQPLTVFKYKLPKRELVTDYNSVKPALMAVRL